MTEPFDHQVHDGQPVRPHEPTKVVVVDDSTLFRQGMATLLQVAGFNVVEQLPSTARLSAVLESVRPDVVIMDVRMPPTHTDEGITTALTTHARYPQLGILVLSTYAEGVWARRLFADGSAHMGYLLKDRVSDVATLASAIARVVEGGTVVDPEVVDHLMAFTAQRTALNALSSRELSVLQLMSEGLSNVGIGKSLFLSARTVETHIAAVFVKLGLPAEDNTLNRRVLAALAFLQATAT
ncbi:MAG: response regulator transcription factor [Dermatophilaceae bacterium]